MLIGGILLWGAGPLIPGGRPTNPRYYWSPPFWLTIASLGAVLLGIPLGAILTFIGLSRGGSWKGAVCIGGFFVLMIAWVLHD